MKFSGLITAWLLSASVTASAALVDQSMTMLAFQDAGGMGLSPSSTTRLGQEFTPTFTSLDYAAAGLSSSGGSTFEARIFSGSLFGTLIGTSGAVAAAQTSFPTTPQMTEFLFSSPLALTAGNIYVLEVVALTGSGTWTYVQDGYPPAPFTPVVGYPGGVFVVNSTGVASFDFTFATGLQDSGGTTPGNSVPISATWTLVALGLFGAGLMTRRTRMASPVDSSRRA